MKYNDCDYRFRRSATVVLVLLAMALGACVKNLEPAKTIEHPSLDVTFLPQKGEFISKYGDLLSLAEITAMARGADYILIGEGHKNVNDHKVQQAVLAALATMDTPPSVGLEMVAVDMQPVLSDFGKGLVDVDGLEEELQWNAKWGYSFELYRGLFEIALRNSLPVAGLNVPTRITKKITKEGLEALDEDERAFLPTEIVPPSSEQEAFLDKIFARHAGLEADNATQRERFGLVQSIWDSKMAEVAVALRKEYDWPVLIVAGSGHVENGWGIAMRLRRFDPGAKVLMIMPWRGGMFVADEGDVFFYSPDSYESKMGATLTDTGGDGLLVERVSRGSRAAKAGLRPGDILIEASGIRLEHLFSLHMAGSKVHKAGEELVFTVQRCSETFTVNVGKLGDPKQAPSSEAAAEGEQE